MDNDVSHIENSQKRSFLKKTKSVVIKVGSAVLTDKNGLDRKIITSLCRQLASLSLQGIKVILVSSGAIAAAAGKVSERGKGKTIPEKQALAALGQSSLIQAYEESFDAYGIKVAQILITRQGLIPRNRYINAKNTIKTLLDWSVIPIINENDTVAVEELQFTDNDALAVLVVNIAEADLLICLSDTHGLYDSDPGSNSNAKIIREVKVVDKTIFKMAGEKPGRAGRGGMKSKLEAARMANACGFPMIIAGGRDPDVITRIFREEEIGTLFHPTSKKRIYGRKSWIAMALERKGVIEIDEGAVIAITEKGKSLLPVGILDVKGNFEAGECVTCRDSKGKDISAGITNYSSDELRKLAGCHCRDIICVLGCSGSKEAIHRDNMVTLI